MSASENKLPFDAVEAKVREWAEWMDVTAQVQVQVGSFDEMAFPEPAHRTGHELGATFSSPDGKAFIVCISDTCPPEKLDRVIVHELVHVHTFEQSGPDEREAMEVATDLAAQLVLDYRRATEQALRPVSDEMVERAIQTFHRRTGAPCVSTIDEFRHFRAALEAAINGE